jgi:hypothetical protein
MESLVWNRSIHFLEKQTNKKGKVVGLPAKLLRHLMHVSAEMHIHQRRLNLPSSHSDSMLNLSQNQLIVPANSWQASYLHMTATLCLSSSHTIVAKD